VAAAAFVFVVIFVLTTFVPSPQAQTEALKYGFTPEQIDDGLRYTLERKLIFWAAAGTSLLFWTVLVLTGGGRKLADLCGRLTGQRWLLTVLLVGAVCFLIQTSLALPFGLARLEAQRAWGMTSRPVSDWLFDLAKSLAISAVIGAPLLVGFYLLLRIFPKMWWLVATAAGIPLAIGYAFLMPILIDPLFSTFHPLEDARLRQKVQVMAAQAGVPVTEILVTDASRKSLHTNAYFTGFGSTRRIVVYDTLLKKHQPAEIESILGHEIGHWQNNHIVKGILLGAVGVGLGFFLLAQCLRWAVARRPFLLLRPSDPAGWPLILLLMEVGSWVSMPIQNSIGRNFERQADQAALELAGQPEAFKAAQVRLARDNIGNVAPSPLSVWLFASHPPALERIRMAEDWEKQHPKK
jgi:STE24 endopeptidase